MVNGSLHDFVTLPPKLPTSGPFGRLYQWLNELRDFCASVKPVESFGTEVSRSAIGTTQSVKKSLSDNEINAPRWG